MRSVIYLGGAAPSEARRAVRSHLEGHDVDVVHTAELLTTELVTNALVHGGGEATLVVALGDSGLHVEVIDQDPTIGLAPLSVDVTAERGRGLAIVDALSRSWGVESRPQGKAVWFEIDV